MDFVVGGAFGVLWEGIRTDPDVWLRIHSPLSLRPPTTPFVKELQKGQESEIVHVRVNRERQEEKFSSIWNGIENLVVLTPVDL